MKPITFFMVLLTACAPAAIAAAAAQDSSATDAWQLSQRKDPARDYPYARFTLAGRFVETDRSGTAPSLVLECLSDRDAHPLTGRVISANVSAGVALKVIYVEPEEIHGTSYFQKVAVLYRIDGASAERRDWSVGSDKVSTVIPNESLARILRARTVTITADDSKGVPLTMRFDIPEASAVREACDLK